MTCEVSPRINVLEGLEEPVRDNLNDGIKLRKVERFASLMDLDLGHDSIIKMIIIRVLVN